MKQEDLAFTTTPSTYIDPTASSKVTFHRPDDSPIATIDLKTGKVEVGEGASGDEASLTFWEAFGVHSHLTVDLLRRAQSQVMHMKGVSECVPDCLRCGIDRYFGEDA